MKNKKERDLGQYFTNRKLVDKAYYMIDKHFDRNNYTVADTSAGGGDFYDIDIYNDIDNTIDLSHLPETTTILNENALMGLKLPVTDKSLMLVGNPPYNDVFAQGKDSFNLETKPSLKSRDLGISFLKSYAELGAEVVCVLHPLSYLIKKSNFNQLKQFKDGYKLIDALIIPSSEFKGTGKLVWPIVIALYTRDIGGMDYDYIRDFEFSIMDTNRTLKLSKYNYIEEYHTKYHQKSVDFTDYKHFYTMRDMNRLVASGTWLPKETKASIQVSKDKEYLFDNIVRLKEWYKENQEEYYYLGNLSPVVIDSDVDINEFFRGII